MSDRLPSMHIVTDGNAQEFLERIQSLILETNNFQIEFHKDFLGTGFDILDLTPQFTTSHLGLFGQLIIEPQKEGVIVVEMKAERWNPEPPTYKTYVDSAKEIIAPLLKSYNSVFKTQHKLSIQSVKNLKPKLPPRASLRFYEFITMANKQMLHPLDWKRFYYFIYACSPKNVKTSQDDVMELLLLSGFSDDDSNHLASIFGHGVSILRLARR